MSTEDDIPGDVDGIPLRYLSTNTVRPFFELIDDVNRGTSARWTQMWFSEDPEDIPGYDREYLWNAYGVRVEEWEKM